MIPGELREDARRQLAALRQLLAPADVGDVRDWLISLGLLVVSGNREVDDAAARVDAYAAMLQVPRGVLTKDTLNGAAKAFRWWPSYSEVSKFLDDEAGHLRCRERRLEAIIYGKSREMEAEETWTGPRQVSEAVERALAEMRRNLGARS